MPRAQLRPSRGRIVIAAAITGLFALEAGALAGNVPGSKLGPTAEAKVQIRLSVRPMVRVSQAAPAASLTTSATASGGTICLWSNFAGEDFALRAEGSDGTELPLTAAKANCAGPGMRGVSLAEAAADLDDGQPVLLLIEGR